MKKVKEKNQFENFTDFEDESAAELIKELDEKQTPFELSQEKTQPKKAPQGPNLQAAIIEFLPQIKRQISFSFHMLDSQEDREFLKKEKGFTSSRLTKLYLSKGLFDILTISEFLTLAEMAEKDQVPENQLPINF